MKTYIKIVAICLAVAGWQGAFGAGIDEVLASPLKSYSILDMYRMALERAERIRVSEENRHLAELDREKALSVLLPGLTTFGDYTRYSQEEMAGDFVIQPESTATWGFKAGQSFTLNGKELIALKIAEEIIECPLFDDFFGIGKISLCQTV